MFNKRVGLYILYTRFSLMHYTCISSICTNTFVNVKPTFLYDPCGACETEEV